MSIHQDQPCIKWDFPPIDEEKSIIGSDQVCHINYVGSWHKMWWNSMKDYVCSALSEAMMTKLFDIYMPHQASVSSAEICLQISIIKVRIPGRDFIRNTETTSIKWYTGSFCYNAVKISSKYSQLRPQSSAMGMRYNMPFLFSNLVRVYSLNWLQMSIIHVMAW